MAQILFLLKRKGVLSPNSAKTVSDPLLGKSSFKSDIENLLKIQSTR